MSFGFYEVRMKPNIVSGTVGSFFLMNKWVPNNWEHKEIDIEFTGNKKTSIQMTTHDYQQGGTVHNYSTTTKELGFDISEEYHNYGILWTQDSVSWFVDGKWLHSEKKYVPQVPLQIRLNHWAGNTSVSNMKKWLREVQEDKLPSIVQYDWIKYRSLAYYFKH
ncbi:MAG: beta-glucanase [Chitinophagaceae bacterium]|nr:beta-glucanase [Chitinophagaceae bacterium]